MEQENIRNFKKTLYRLALIVLIGFLSNVLYNYIFGNWYKRGYPYNTFVFNPDDIFGDFVNLLPNVKTWPLNPYFNEEGVWASYFPFSFIVAYIFHLIDHYFIRNISILSFFAMFFLAYGYWIRDIYLDYSKKMQNSIELVIPFIVLFFLNYPLLFMLDRANFESFVFIFLMYFLYAYNKRPYLSALSLAAAISMKFFPAIFVCLYLSERKFKQAAATVFFAFGLTLLSLLCFKGDIVTNVSGMLMWQKKYFESFAVGNSGYPFSHSFFTFVKSIMYFNLPEFNVSVQTIRTILNEYILTVLACFTGIFFFILKDRVSFFGKFTLLTLASLAFPYVSTDYRLIHILLIVFLIFRENPKFASNKLYESFVFLLGLLLIPKSYKIKQELMNLGMIVNPMLLFVLMGIVIYNEIKLIQSNKNISMSQPGFLY